MEIGGGFGGKISRLPRAGRGAAVARRRPAGEDASWTAPTSSKATGPTPGSYIRVKMGADEDGKLVAGEAYLAYEAGAYPGSPVGPGCMCVFACYDIPNVQRRRLRRRS